VTPAAPGDAAESPLDTVTQPGPGPGGEGVADRCRICLGELGGPVTAHEHIYGTRQPFEYARCSRCGCLQLLRADIDLSPFYEGAYGPLHVSKAKTYVRAVGYWMGYNRVPGSGFLGAMFPFFHAGVLSALRKYSSKGAALLDVGSGQGRFLSALRMLGFVGDLIGVDPFLPDDVSLPNGVRLMKTHLADVVGRFDVVTCIHAFEHVPDPEPFFAAIRGLLGPGGVCLVSVPVAGGWVDEHYREDWVQLDPPRHVFLHTADSVRHLAEVSGLEVREVLWDSTSFQFWGSELVRRRIPVAPFWKSYARCAWRLVPDTLRAMRVNRSGGGDQATFVIAPASESGSGAAGASA
jgi:SAM-dependent methyltransferase